MKTHYFGTDGIRGPFGGELVNRETLIRLTSALASRLTTEGNLQPITIVVGRDTRTSGTMLTNWLAEGFGSHPVRLLDLGIMPTPAIAWNTRRLGANIGIALTASHNPASDNGIKLFTASGTKLNPEEELLIEQAMDSKQLSLSSTGDWSFERESHPTALADYLQAAGQAFEGLNLSRWRIVCDTANGATCQTTPILLKKLGAEVITLANEPNGLNINAQCGSEHPQAVQDAVLKFGAQIGIAHDGDGDRVIFVDHTGSVVPGDQILGLLAIDALNRNSLVNKTLVVTHQSNLGLDHTVRSAGGRVLRSDIGDRNVAILMNESGAILGGESSGHIILRHLNPTGDGMLAALALLKMLTSDSQPLHERRMQVTLFPQATVSCRVSERRPLTECAHLAASADKARAILGNSGRVMIRYSGTEPKLRFLVEAPSEIQATEILHKLTTAALQDLNIEKA